MSHFPDCRTDEYYNEKFLGKPKKDFISGFDWCVEMAVDSFFDNEMFELALPETYLGHVLCEELPEDMQDEYEQEHVFLNDGENEQRKVKTYADLIRYKLLYWIEISRNELITGMIDDMSDGEYAASSGKAE